MSGRLYGLGLGPGDPELLTLKALRILRQVPVIAWPAPETGDSLARSIAAPHLPGGQQEIAIRVPMRVERFPAREVYDRAAAEIAAQLDAGRDVALLCEGDPFFYGSFMYVFERLAGAYDTEVVPGVSSVMAAAAVAGRPLAARNDVLSIIPGPLADEVIAARLDASEAAVIIKVGRHFKRLRALIEKMNLLPQAFYIERVGLPNQRVLPLADLCEETAPYFSMLLIYRGAESWGRSDDAAGHAADARSPSSSDYGKC
ncbi:precorrin-2 C(20)-methyltransferase [Pseudohoeflea coraliihabitans]|uniref:Precorrin-2 C(20)-methyltransferase n=1 Tax=Pseudohoeflea coraliihabitans TaxID=2860393 RepID=A0ABS6WKT8_9HYPH|nr:precorrin-2 C(20)-methyltransferase [Pseudohoeflea sp. DP4N28-3]MBW3095745.1 precorrin-2 C(20)-methyltransferase [Pseudohoeflea sp. DP4N28-3]